MSKRRKLTTLGPGVRVADLRSAKPVNANRQATRAMHTWSPAWRRLRQEVLVEQGYACQLCGKMSDRNEVDHEDGNSHNNSRSNLRVLCPDCHKKHGKQGLSDPNNARPAHEPKYTIA